MFTTISPETWRAFREDTRPGPVQMLNLVRLRTEAAYPDSRKATGLEAYAEYSRLSAAAALSHGMRIVWRGSFEMTMVGPPTETWDVCFVAEYPGVESFVGLMRHPDYKAAMEHRQAGVAYSRLIRLAAAPPGDRFLSGPALPRRG